MKHAINCRPIFFCTKCGLECTTSKYYAGHTCKQKNVIKKEIAESSTASVSVASKKKGYGIAKEKRRTLDIKKELSNTKTREKKSNSNVFDFNDNEQLPTSKAALVQSKDTVSPASPIRTASENIKSVKSQRKRTTVSTSSGDGEKKPKKQLKVHKKEIFKPQPKVKKIGYGGSNRTTTFATNKRKNNSPTSLKPRICTKRKRKLKNVEDTTPTEMSLSEENNETVVDDNEEDLFTPASISASSTQLESPSPKLPHNKVIFIFYIFFKNFYRLSKFVVPIFV